jgi:glycine cleavage system regulatory protein
MSDSHLLISITSPDRPGIVERITNAIVAHGGSWQASRMARLCGDFAGIVHVTVPAEKLTQLTDALKAMATDELSISMKLTRAVTGQSPTAVRPFHLSLRGADHEGIVHKVAALLSHQGINVESLESGVSPAPVTGTPIFHMRCDLEVPEHASLVQLQADLAAVADDLGVEIELRKSDQPSYSVIPS